MTPYTVRELHDKLAEVGWGNDQMSFLLPHWLREELLSYLAAQLARPEEERVVLSYADADRISEAICAILNMCDEHAPQEKSSMFTELDEARALLWNAIDYGSDSPAARSEDRK